MRFSFLHIAAAGVIAAFLAGSAFLVIQSRHHAVPRATAPASSPASMMPTPSAASSPARHYVTASGDTLTGIARRIYGNSADWWYIYQANMAKIDKSHGALSKGEMLTIPLVTGSRYAVRVTPSPMASPSSMMG